MATHDSARALHREVDDGMRRANHFFYTGGFDTASRCESNKSGIRSLLVTGLYTTPRGPQQAQGQTAPAQPHPYTASVLYSHSRKAPAPAGVPLPTPPGPLTADCIAYLLA